MAYIGAVAPGYDPTRASVPQLDAERFSGNASTTAFTLTRQVVSPTDINVIVENVLQEPTIAYSVNGYTLNFTEAPPTGTNNIYVVYRGSGISNYAFVPDGSITYAKFANNIKQFTVDTFTANGTGSTVALTEAPASANAVIVSVDGVIQTAPTNYTLSGSTITFTGVPDNGANVVVKHIGFRTTSTVTALQAGSVTTTELADSSVTNAKIVSVANTKISGNIVSSQIEPSVTLTTPIISGNLNLDSTGTSGIRLTSANTITFHTTGTEDVRIDANGNVSIGTASAQTKFHVSNTATNTVKTRTESSTGYVEVGMGGNSGVFDTTATDGIRLRMSGVDKVAIDGSTFSISGLQGIKFPATQSASSDANTLDDYEEGTWTPIYFMDGTAGSTTYVQQFGSYVKIGNTVYCEFNVSWNAQSGTGSGCVGGLPFTANAYSSDARAFYYVSAYGGYSVTGVLSVILNPSSTFTLLYVNNNGSVASSTKSTTGQIRGSFWYKV
jgi:hypothetical protein